jgi:uncharacterized membrane protein
MRQMTVFGNLFQNLGSGYIKKKRRKYATQAPPHNRKVFSNLDQINKMVDQHMSINSCMEWGWMVQRLLLFFHIYVFFFCITQHENKVRFA